MARKKKEAKKMTTPTKNKYALMLNGRLVESVFTLHRTTKTRKLMILQATNLQIDFLSSYASQHPGHTWIAKRLEHVKANTHLLTFATPMMAKIWLISHSSLQGAKDSAFFLTEEAADRIISKHKYDFRRGFAFEKSSSRPLLCEFEVVRLENVN